MAERGDPRRGRRRSTGTRPPGGTCHAPGASSAASPACSSSTVSEELHRGRERNQVVPLVLERPKLPGRPAVELSFCDHHRGAVLVGAVIVVVGVAEQPLVPRPVVLGAERVVDGDEAAAGADVLAQRRLGRVQVRAGRRVDRRRGIDRACRASAACRGWCWRRSPPCSGCRLESWVTSSVQSAAMPSAASQRISAFCTTLPGAEGRVQSGGQCAARGWRGAGRRCGCRSAPCSARLVAHPVVIAIRVGAAAHAVVEIARDRRIVQVRLHSAAGVHAVGRSPAPGATASRADSSATTTAALTAALMGSPLKWFRRSPQRFVMAGLATGRRIVIAVRTTKRQPPTALGAQQFRTLFY